MSPDELELRRTTLDADIAVLQAQVLEVAKEARQRAIVKARKAEWQIKIATVLKAIVIDDMVSASAEEIATCFVNQGYTDSDVFSELDVRTTRDALVNMTFRIELASAQRITTALKKANFTQ